MEQLVMPILSLYLLSGVAGILIGSLMFMGKFPRNRLIGIRTATSLADPETWYRINRYGGRCIMIAGTIAVLAAVAAMAFRTALGFYASVLVPACVSGVSFAMAGAMTLAHLRDLNKES